MTLKRQFRILLQVQIALGVGLAMLALALFRNEAALSASQRVNFESYLLADELRQSSDDLTRMARSFVATGEERFARQYWAILDIRDGRRPQPQEYHRIYWDLVTPHDTEPRPSGAAAALRDRMRAAGFTDAELAKLSLAQRNSDRLVRTEEVAMNAVRGLFADSSGQFTVRRAPDRAFALRIMFDSTYFAEKARIMRPIDEFYVMLAQRTSGAVAAYERRAVHLLEALGALIVVILVLFGASYVVLQREITRREAAEVSLRRHESELAEAERVSHVGYWRWNLPTDTLQFSDELIRIYGFDPAELDGNRRAVIAQQVVAEDQAHVLAAMARRAEGDTAPIEYRVMRPDGKVRSIVSVPGRAERDATGRIVLLAGVAQDVTEARAAEAERAQLRDQLAHAQRLESVGRLAGGVAHDFNNMLAVILGSLELALKELPPSHPIAPDLLEAQKAARRSADLTRQLLAFARRQTIVPRVVDLNACVSESLAMLRPLLGPELTVAWRAGEALWPVKADPSQLGQVVTNLCVNARDAIDGVGTITAVTENRVIDEAFCAEQEGAVTGDFVCLTVADTGAGMSPDVMRQVFEPFFTTKAQGEGTGLGLSMVYGAVHQNGGFVLVHSTVGQGSRFEVFLPRHVA